MNMRRVLTTGGAVLLATVLAQIGIPQSLAEASSAKPVISSFVMTPSDIVPAGDEVSEKATVSGASRCTLSSSKPTPGLPIVGDCSSGSFDRSVQVPGNSGAKRMSILFTLKAKRGAGSTTATFATTVDPSTSVPKGPSVTKLSTGSGTTSGGTSVRISGHHLNRATSVTFGYEGLNATIMSDTPTSIVVISPIGFIGPFYVYVTTSAGSSAEVEQSIFTDKASSLPPVITGVNPSVGTPAGNNVEISGENISDPTSILFGTQTFPCTWDPSFLGWDCSPSGGTGTVNVTITTPAGTSAISPADQYTY